jgi:hypothetical protein
MQGPAAALSLNYRTVELVVDCLRLLRPEVECRIRARPIVSDYDGSVSSAINRC